VYAWRHPRPIGAEGRCIGRTDLPVDGRKARRLARRIHRFSVANGMPRVVTTSPLRRCADVGRWLRRFGWIHVVEARLAEMDFGAWDGLRWDAVPRGEIDAWVAAFAAYRPGGGEALRELLERAGAWRGDGVGAVVAHAGWISARRWIGEQGARMPLACEWPKGIGYGGGPVRLTAVCSPDVAPPPSP
jgi:alpha-ribazole phosphatase